MQLDDCRSSNSSSSWRRLTPALSLTRRYTGDEEHNIDLDACSSTLHGRLPLPSFYFNLMPPPPLLPLAAMRQSSSSDLKLELVPTPTRADQLLVAPGDEHDVTVCYQARSRRSDVVEEEDVKPAITMSNESSRSADMQIDNAGVMLCQRNHGGVIRQAVALPDGWTTAANRDSSMGQIAAKVSKVTAGGQPAEMAANIEKPVTGESHNGTQTTDEEVASSGERRRRLQPVAATKWQRWASSAQHEYDAKYWERRRKNNEAAKRSGDFNPNHSAGM